MNPSAPRFALAMALPLLLAPAAASTAAPATPAPAPPAAARPVAANNAIIPLPLNPIIPDGQRVCAAQTPSGLGYTILKPASGDRPGGDSTVLVNYIGYLAATGAVFDQAMQSPLPVQGVIPGFSEGLQLVAPSGVVRICIPAALGYGERASGPIPANSDLVFQIEVLDFRTAAQLESMRNAQAAPPSSSPPAPPQGDAAPQP